jgi:hypothetical protein
MAAHQIRNDLLRQEVENLWIAEEAGDVDEEVLDEEGEFVLIAVQDLDIPVRIGHLDRCHDHAPLYPPQKRAWLVEREIMGGPGAQEIDDLR